MKKRNPMNSNDYEILILRIEAIILAELKENPSEEVTTTLVNILDDINSLKIDECEHKGKAEVAVR